VDAENCAQGDAGGRHEQRERAEGRSHGAGVIVRVDRTELSKNIVEWPAAYTRAARHEAAPPPEGAAG